MEIDKPSDKELQVYSKARWLDLDLLRTATGQMRTGGLIRLPWPPTLGEDGARPHKVLAQFCPQ